MIRVSSTSPNCHLPLELMDLVISHTCRWSVHGIEIALRSADEQRALAGQRAGQGGLDMLYCGKTYSLLFLLLLLASPVLAMILVG